MERNMRDIPGFQGRYAATTAGEIWSYQEERFLSPYVNDHGYLVVTLRTKKDFGEQRNYKVHRLVAMTFIPNPEDKPEVDHINQNKLDCSLNNLRWVTSAENKANSS